MAEDFTQRLKNFGIVPVLVIDDAETAEPLATALAEGGLPCAEVTFRTAAAPEALARMAKIPGLCVGAGTVTTPEQVGRAVDAGATFVVSPGWSAAVTAEARSNGIFVLPGVCTPTEIMAALADGLTTLKFFPAESFGGAKTLKALCAPFGQVEFVPTGGITTDNLADYLALPKVAACGASWMAAPELIRKGDWAEIVRRTRLAVDMVRRLRNGSAGR